MGSLYYWFEWPKDSKFLTSHDAEEKYPGTLKDFLETKISFERPVGAKSQVDGRMKADSDFYVGYQIGRFFFKF